MYEKPQSAIRQRPYKKEEELRSERSVDGIDELVKLPLQSRNRSRIAHRDQEKENYPPSTNSTNITNLRPLQYNNINSNPILIGNTNNYPQEKLVNRNRN